MELPHIHLMRAASDRLRCLVDGSLLGFMQIKGFHTALQKKATRRQIMDACLIAHG